MAEPLIWANLLHLSYNMWLDTPGESPISYSPDLRCDDDLWAELTQRMADVGFTMIVIDLGDGVRFESHPEIAVNGAWSLDRLGEELARLRALGLEPIPKLNFSACHDAWLGEYSRMVSTKIYYEVCTDLIDETARLFDGPRLFHIGMDEEAASYQANMEYAVMRQHDLWWRDLQLFADAVDRTGARPWIWSDHAWRHPDSYYEKMPQRLLQSNWYYQPGFTADESGRPRELGHGEHHLTYLDLDDHGYDQIPTGSNWNVGDNFSRTVDFCTERLDPARLLGFLQTPWKATIAVNRDHHLEAIDDAAKAIKATS
ncbi:Tat pathway signal protein [Microlunatus speluncae]|uniref:Tat pathway signal protein n=1 Tax=Microlunatus speluncae TaxID=2594267 RepID=UPI00126621BD|nr:Tat pathway signal protein [Microlunatus speluncae]